MEGFDLSKNINKILVIGATGKQGQAFVRSFCELSKPEDNFKLVCLSRDTHTEKCFELVQCDDTGSRVECVHGNLLDLLESGKEQHITNLIRDCNGMFIVLQPGEHEAQIGKKLIEIAAKENVQNIVYSSVANPDSATSVPYFSAKKEIEDCLVSHQGSFDFWCIIRPVFFFHNLLKGNISNKLKQENVLEMPLPSDCCLQMVDSGDVGRLAAIAFLQPQEFHQRKIDFVGDQKTMNEYASCLGVEYREKSLDSVSDENTRKMYQWLQSKGFNGDLNFCRSLLSNLQTFESWAQKNDLISSEQMEKSRQRQQHAADTAQQVQTGTA